MTYQNYLILFKKKNIKIKEMNCDIQVSKNIFYFWTLYPLFSLSTPNVVLKNKGICLDRPLRYFLKKKKTLVASESRTHIQNNTGPIKTYEHTSTSREGERHAYLKQGWLSQHAEVMHHQCPFHWSLEQLVDTHPYPHSRSLFPFDFP